MDAPSRHQGAAYHGNDQLTGDYLRAIPQRPQRYKKVLVRSKFGLDSEEGW